jgi:hypothetical protein
VSRSIIFEVDKNTQKMLDSLLRKVNSFFPNHNKTCLRNILILSLAILQKETVCLNRLKTALGSITGNRFTKSGSNYKRLIRIFDNHAFSSLWLDLLKYVFLLLRLKTDYLLLDGTSWKHGDRWYHYITLCVVYQGVAIPIYWLDLHKQGTSNFKERKRLFNKAKRHFNLTEKTLIADREYIGKEWFKFLIDNNINFVIRSKTNAYKKVIDAAPGKTLSQMVKKIMRSRMADKAVRKEFWLNGVKLYIVVVRNPKKNAKEPYLLLITNMDKPAATIAQIYPIRWKIEHCFKHLKSNGFCLETINLKGAARQHLLMAVMVFTYVLSVMEGLKVYDTVAVKEYHGEERQSKAESVFRVGINQLAQYCTSLVHFCEFITQRIKQALGGYRSANILNV